MKQLRSFAQAAAVRSPIVSSVADRLDHPLFAPLFRRMYRPERMFHDSTDLVIDGFPRSANTFAVMAMKHSNPHLRISHHLHYSLSPRLAARKRVPALVLLRNPMDAVVSYLIFAPQHGPEDLLRRYTRFYLRCDRARDGIVFAPFEVVTSDFGMVVDAVNRRYGAKFQPFHHTKDGVQTIFRQMEEMQHDERKQWRPSSERASVKEGVRARLDQVSPDLVSEAEEAWQNALRLASKSGLGVEST